MVFEAPEPLVLPRQTGPLALMPSDCPSLEFHGPVSIDGRTVKLGDADMVDAFQRAFVGATRQTPGGEQRQCGYCVATFKFYSS